MSSSSSDDDLISDGKQSSPESVAAVLKVFAILNALGERNETGISELSVRLAMPKATVYRFLQTMKTLGYVRQEVDSERYGLSMKVFELGAKALEILKKELDITMALCGERDVKNLRRENLLIPNGFFDTYN